MSATKAKYCIGHLIHHKIFDYRGIIVGVDLVFSNSDEWYDKVAKSNPQRTSPGIMCAFIMAQIILMSQNVTWKSIRLF